jgi:hypothetical protein
MTIAVQVHTMSVSITGPSMATRPSRIGSLVRAAPWAMTSVPTPASLEKAPRLMPISMTPMKPPPAACGVEGLADDAGQYYPGHVAEVAEIT